MRSNVVYLTAISRGRPSKITHAWINVDVQDDSFFFEAKAGLLTIISALSTGLDHMCLYKLFENCILSLRQTFVKILQRIMVAKHLTKPNQTKPMLFLARV